MDALELPNPCEADHPRPHKGLLRVARHAGKKAGHVYPKTQNDHPHDNRLRLADALKGS